MKIFLFDFDCKHYIYFFFTIANRLNPKGKENLLIKYFSKEKIFLKILFIKKFGTFSTSSIKLIFKIFNNKIDIDIGINKKKLK